MLLANANRYVSVAVVSKLPHPHFAFIAMPLITNVENRRMQLHIMHKEFYKSPIA
jgi:hypothetical protein